MKKIVFSLGIVVSAMMFTTAVMAQQARETQVTYMKKVTQAYEQDYNISKSDLEDIVENYFKNNIKGKRLKSNGYALYKGVDWTEISNEKLDVYYKVEGNKKTSKLIIMVSKGYDNFVSTQSDAIIGNQVLNFLQKFNVHIDNFKREENIQTLKKEIEKKEKNLKSFDDEEKKLRNKIKDLEKDIEKNNKKRNDAISEIEKEKARLQQL